MTLYTAKKHYDSEEVITPHLKKVVLLHTTENKDQIPEASAPPIALAESVPLPFNQSHELNHSRNHNRVHINRKDYRSEKSKRSSSSTFAGKTDHVICTSKKKGKICIKDEESLDKIQIKKNGACWHLMYTIFLFCIVWPLAFLTANLWVLSKVCNHLNFCE